MATGNATDTFVFYQESARYWVKATVGLPHYAKNGRVGAPAHGRHLYVDSARRARISCAILHSSLFYTYFIAYGDCFHVSDSLATSLPVPPAALNDRDLDSLGAKLMRDLERNAEKKTINTKAGDQISYDEFRVGESKLIIDEIDSILARHYGFTEEELDFIANYDIKYRMGRDAEGDEAE